MALKDYLLEGEEILAQAGDFHATNKRLIRYQKQLWAEELDELRYSQISLSLRHRRRQGLLLAGLFFLGIGVLILLLSIALSLARELVAEIPSLSFGPWPVLLLALGLLLTALSFFLPRVYVQIRAPGIDARNEESFRITGVKSAQVKGLLAVIRRQLYP